MIRTYWKFLHDKAHLVPYRSATNSAGIFKTYAPLYQLSYCIRLFRDWNSQKHSLLLVFHFDVFRVVKFLLREYSYYRVGPYVPLVMEFSYCCKSCFSLQSH